MEKLRFLAALALLASAAPLSGCGGGGGGAADTPSFSSTDRGTLAPSETEATSKSSCGTAEAPLRIMPLVDSITESTVGHSSYRKALYEMLEQSGCVVDFVGSRHGVSAGITFGPESPPRDPNFDQDSEGHWGFRADQILQHIPEWAKLASPDIVLMHLGTNDLFQSQSVPSTLLEIELIINELRAVNPNVQILLAKLIPSSRNRDKIENFNSRIPELAHAVSSSGSPVIVVDQYSDFYVSSDTFDEIHPNDSGELKMAGRWFNALMELLFS